MLQHENPKTMVGVSLIWLQKVQGQHGNDNCDQQQRQSRRDKEQQRGTRHEASRTMLRQATNFGCATKLLANWQQAGCDDCCCCCALPLSCSHKNKCLQHWLQAWALQQSQPQPHSQSAVASRTRSCSCSCSWLEFGPTRIFASL